MWKNTIESLSSHSKNCTAHDCEYELNVSKLSEISYLFINTLFISEIDSILVETFNKYLRAHKQYSLWNFPSVEASKSANTKY